MLFIPCRNIAFLRVYHHHVSGEDQNNHLTGIPRSFASVLSSAFISFTITLPNQDLYACSRYMNRWRSPVTPAVRGDLRKTILVDPLKVPINSEETWIYGTRLSTVILVRRDGSATFIERDIWKLDSDGKPVKGDSVKGDRVHTFKLTPRDN